MLPTSSFVWVIRQDLACGHWRNQAITEKHGIPGSIFQILPQIVKYTLEKVP